MNTKKRVAINGLGRIGRALFKLIGETEELELIAINDLVSPENLSYLINYDSVYGKYERKTEYDEDRILQGEKEFRVYSEEDPGNLAWKELGIDIVFDCTGIFNRRKDLEKHIHAGAGKVLLSAPAKDDDIEMVVFGVNTPSDSSDIISCASCTTNCIAPVMEVLDRNLGVEKAALTTVHAYTSTQGIVDSPNKKMRRGRAAAENFVPTTTGATRAAIKVLPQLEGKFEGSAIRGPVPVGSISDIDVVISKDASVEEINELFIKESTSQRYKGIMAVTNELLVSTDIIKDAHASIVDLNMTMSIGGNLIKVMSWYDNEWGYANQMVRTAKHLAIK